MMIHKFWSYKQNELKKNKIKKLICKNINKALELSR